MYRKWRSQRTYMYDPGTLTKEGVGNAGGRGEQGGGGQRGEKNGTTVIA